MDSKMRTSLLGGRMGEEGACCTRKRPSGIGRQDLADVEVGGAGECLDNIIVYQPSQPSY